MYTEGCIEGVPGEPLCDAVQLSVPDELVFSGFDCVAAEIIHTQMKTLPAIPDQS